MAYSFRRCRRTGRLPNVSSIGSPNNDGRKNMLSEARWQSDLINNSISQSGTR
jgi:hypothetical protein